MTTETREHVVILVHGIRDFSRWHANVRPALERAGLVVQPTNYGRMNLLEFLLPVEFFRAIAAERVLTQIRFAKQLHPDADVSVIAHSFGTYVVSRLLQSEFDLKLHRVIFCGSVVRYSFPFEQLGQRFSPPILNEVGTSDPWPAVAEAVTTGYGSAGTFGFNRSGVTDRYHNDAGHGYFLTPEFASKFWVKFLHSGEIVPGSHPAKDPPRWVQLIAILKVKYLLIILLALWIALKFTQVLVGANGATSFHFGGDPYVYWNDPVRILLQQARQPCPLPLNALCRNGTIVRGVTGREFIAIQEEDARIRQIVSCGSFEVTDIDPNVALKKLFARYPSCLSMTRGTTGWILRLNADGVTTINQSSDKPVHLCGCTTDQELRFAKTLQ